MKSLSEVLFQLSELKELLNLGNFDERQRRTVYGFVARKLGYGGVAAVAKALDVSPITVRKALTEILAATDPNSNTISTPAQTGRIRREGGGRKSVTETQPGILEAIREIVDDRTYGDPERIIAWTTLSLRKIQELLAAKGFKVSHTVVGEILENLGYSKQVNQKMLQVNAPHPDRDAQFRFINDKSAKLLSEGCPVVSVDCKKKELVGNFKNGGAEYRMAGCPRKVLDHDFELKNLGKVAPYGVYVLNNNTAFVNLGTSSDTAEFAGESVWRWWNICGRDSFAGVGKLFIICDGGGSNGCRIRLWKWALADLAEKTGLEIHVSHLPPGTSKWNKIEHRLFCYISKSWAAQPLVDIETVVSLIGATTTKTGLVVKCEVDDNEYERGIKISDDEFATIDIEPIGDFGQWNYVVRGFLKE